MPSPRDPFSRLLPELVKILLRLPPRVLIALLAIALIGVVVAFFLCNRPATQQQAGPPGTYLFCSWNVENFFDDNDDPKIGDKSEDWFGQNPEMFRLKVQHLAEALLMMNDGRGPDIMALYEVESERSMNALKDALNERLVADGKAESKYETVLFLGDHFGRHFGPGILTRLPVQKDRTHKYGEPKNGRNLEGHLFVNGHELTVLAAHWTSRVERRGKGGSGEDHANAARRMSYAKDQYGRFRAILTANPDADVLLCGDFNDEFSDASMQEGLHAAATDGEMRSADGEVRPLALFAHLSANSEAKGTIYYRRTWSTFDHICVSRGLLDDRGWTCDPNTAAIFAPSKLRHGSSGEPFRFGDAKAADRGYSDHFPVAVRLAVEGNNGR